MKAAEPTSDYEERLQYRQEGENRVFDFTPALTCMTRLVVKTAVGLIEIGSLEVKLHGIAVSLSGLRFSAPGAGCWLFGMLHPRTHLIMHYCMALRSTTCSVQFSSVQFSSVQHSI